MLDEIDSSAFGNRDGNGDDGGDKCDNGISGDGGCDSSNGTRGGEGDDGRDGDDNHTHGDGMEMVMIMGPCWW